MPPHDPDVLVASDTTADFYPQEVAPRDADAAADPATDAVGRAYRWVVAGTGTNVARGLAILDDPPHLATDVGSDSLGRAVRAELAAHDLDGRLVRAVDRPTPIALYVPAAAGGPDWEIRRAESSYGFALDPDDAAAVFPDLSLLYLSGTTLPPAVSLDAIRTALTHASRHDVTVAFDLNGRRNLWAAPSDYAARVREVLAETDVVFAGDDDLALAGQPATLDGLRDLLPAEADCTAFLTHGEAGATAARIADGAVVERATHDGFAVESVADPAGAGDALVSAVLAARRRGVADLSALLRAGTAAGAAAVTSVGPLRAADLQTFADLEDGHEWPSSDG